MTTRSIALPGARVDELNAWTDVLSPRIRCGGAESEEEYECKSKETEMAGRKHLLVC